jgi:hypothetical protein
VQKINWLAVGASLALLVGDWVAARPQKDYIEMQVISPMEKNSIWMRPYTAPAFNFKVVDGGKVQEAGLHCTWKREDRTRTEHIDQIIVFTCGEHKLELQMVDFSY